MLTPVVPLRPRKNPPRRYARLGPPPAPAALVLVSATYNADFGPTVRLAFDRPIDIEAIDGAAITVADGENLGLRFNGNGGAAAVNPTTVDVVLVETDSYEGAALLLNATAGTGIVAVGDGAAWAGVVDLAMPFP